jgi:hypothetical protein
MEHLDAPLFQTLNTLPTFPFARMVRPDRLGINDARSAFFAHRTLPTFSYSLADRFDTAGYARALNAVADRIESLPAIDVVRALYREKIEELRTRCSLIHAIQQKDDVAVTSIADHIFGAPKLNETLLTDEYGDILGRAHEFHMHEERVDAALFTTMTRTMLDHYGMNDWTTRETTRPNVTVIHSDVPTIKIPKKYSASRARAARLLTHEIEVHALRSHNGRTSPLLLLGKGLAQYITTDEGLAIALQQTLRGKDSTDPAFWDAWAVALTINHGFVDVFDTIVAARTKLNTAIGRERAIEEAQNTAWRLMLRVSRGLHTPGAVGLGYRRDHIYRSGLIEIHQVFHTHGKAAILPTLFAGHAGIQHILALKALGLTGRTPDMIGTQVVKDVMLAHRKTRA